MTNPDIPEDSVMQIDVINMNLERVEKVEVSEAIVDAPENESLLYEVVRQHQMSGRQGTAATKNRALVQGSGRKLWKQKGTGRARIGSIRSPLWRHGGTVFGPHPRDYSYRIPSKKRIAALRSVLGQKLRNQDVVVVDEMNFEQPKVKAAIDFLNQLELTSGVLFVDSRANRNLQLSVRNLKNVKFLTVPSFNVVDALHCKTLVISKHAFGQLTGILAQ